ncbi:ECs_2282 family putative zinc-binding protein [Edwardsiella ictaluri]|uniref:ECs_2282 family putative zinc-binding protein n=1 Tax=Edwardsiella ictaluri TaxID=67780 RepID=UPI0039F257FD
MKRPEVELNDDFTDVSCASCGGTITKDDFIKQANAAAIEEAEKLLRDTFTFK